MTVGAGVLKKIGEVAEQLGTTPRALRFYEEEGLVSARRTPGGTRLYSDEDVGRFRAILKLTQLGMPLALVKDLATTRERHATGAEASHDVHELLSRLQHQVREQIETLGRLETDLAKASSAVANCFACGNPPTRRGCPQCPVNNLRSDSEVLGLIWEQDISTDTGDHDP